MFKWKFHGFSKPSLTASRIVLRQGMQLSIGNGNSINVCNQPWLNSNSHPYVSGLPQIGLENLTVADLIDQTSFPWRKDIIDQIFTPTDAAQIQQIPLFHISNWDILTWKHNASDNYSGNIILLFPYHAIMECVFNTQHLKVPGNWLLLWKLKLSKLMAATIATIFNNESNFSVGMCIRDNLGQFQKGKVFYCSWSCCSLGSRDENESNCLSNGLLFGLFKVRLGLTCLL